MAGFKQDDRITLRRGLILPAEQLQQFKVGDDIPIHGNVIESWSVSKNIAAQFAGGGGHPFAPNVGPDDIGMVLEMDIPVSDIMGSAKTGWGCVTEGEFIITNSNIGNSAKVTRIFTEADYD